jgi:serine protease AprX
MSAGVRARRFITSTALVLCAPCLCVAVSHHSATPAPASAAPAPTASALDQWAKSKWGNDTTKEGEKASADGVWRADRDHGSLNWIERNYGVKDTWGKVAPDGQKVTGAGVTVAVIDTGVAPVPGLNAPGKVIDGPDLSFDSQNPLTRYLDGYGHGTHMAGIIAGRDDGVPVDKFADPKNMVGIAPNATILNMKVATADGSVDVSQVIAAVNWVVQHRQDHGMNVRVINLSYGTHSTQGYEVDPLAKAVEDAWRAGIVVVAAAGNDGGSAPLTMPAADPYVISVGAVDNRGTDSFKDDSVAPFSAGGSTAVGPDLLAPGKSVVSLRVPGSDADVEHPEGLVPGDARGRFFRGSGTSQAAAVVSGAAALLIQARPALTPDQVKRILTSSADKLETDDSPGVGAGVIDVKAALSTPVPGAAAIQRWPLSTGTGSLQAARGDAMVVDPDSGVSLTGEMDALGTPWDAVAWAAASTNGTAWNGGEWNGRPWTGVGWTGRSWSGDSWEARSWSGRSWSGTDWQGRSWSATGWLGRSWSGEAWSGRSWSSSQSSVADSW